MSSWCPMCGQNGWSKYSPGSDLCIRCGEAERKRKVREAERAAPNGGRCEFMEDDESDDEYYRLYFKTAADAEAFNLRSDGPALRIKPSKKHPGMWFMLCRR